MERNTSGNRSTGRWSWKIRTAWCRKKMKLTWNRSGERRGGKPSGRGQPVYRCSAGCEIVAVKLRPAKQYLRDYYRIAEQRTGIQYDDILLAVKYVQQFVIPLYRPIVICLGLGTSFGSHSGVSLFSEYLQRIARSVSQAVVIGGGNEGNTAGHFRGRLTENQQQVELRVGEGVTGFTAELWGSKPSVFRLAVRHPAGSSCRRWNLVWAAQWNTRLSMKRRGYRLQILQTNAIPEIS